MPLTLSPALVRACQRPPVPDTPTAADIGVLLIDYDDALAECDNRMAAVRKLTADSNAQSIENH